MEYMLVKCAVEEGNNMWLLKRYGAVECETSIKYSLRDGWYINIFL